MIKKIVFCLILLCCMSSVAFAENPSDNVNETTTNDNQDIITFVPYLIYNCTNLDPTHIDYYKDCNYTDTYMVDAETGKYIPLGEITKPLPENMVKHYNHPMHNGWGLTYEDIMNHNYETHPLK